MSGRAGSASDPTIAVRKITAGQLKVTAHTRMMTRCRGSAM